MRSRSNGEARRLFRSLVPAALFLLAIAIRALPWRDLLVAGQVRPFGFDAYYHLRRILYSVLHFPTVLHFDAYINFPEGAKPIWPPIFDWTVALLALPFYRVAGLAGVEWVAMWVPPLLGGATVVAVYALAKRHFDWATAVLSALILSVLSAHFWYSQIGFVDHHAAVALTSTLLLAATMSLLDRDASAAANAWRPAVATGLALAAALLVWPGSLLHVGIAESGLLVYLLGRPRGDRAIAFARRFALAQAVACVAVLPFCWGSGWPQWSEFSPLVLSYFQPWMFASLTLYGLVCAWLWSRPGAGGSRGARLVSGFAVGAALLGTSLLLAPELWAGVEDAWHWMSRRESFQALVAESRPLLERDGRFTTLTAVQRLSWFVLFFPAAAIAAGVWAWRRPNRHALLLWVGWSMALFAVTLLQRRFFNSFSVAMALVMGWSICQGDRLLSRFAGRFRLGSWATRVALVGLVLVLLAPLQSTYRPHVTKLLDPSSDSPQLFTPMLAKRWMMVELAGWMSRRTPVTVGWMDSSGRPAYAVLAPWDMGHVIEYVARRPSVTDNFGDDIGAKNFELARRYYRSRERPASAILDRLGARYVVAQRDSGFLGDPPGERSVFSALYLHDGSEFTRQHGARKDEIVPALTRHRLVYESRLKVENDIDGRAHYKLFEHVPGAQIAGRAAPGARIRLRLRLFTNRDRKTFYRASATADSKGRYRLRVPYANKGGPPSVRPGSHYILYCGDESVRVRIAERQVWTGAQVRAPDLCL
jgi:dolichyl-diphosphooligosaccharide--protein glycosyltransferase